YLLIFPSSHFVLGSSPDLLLPVLSLFPLLSARNRNISTYPGKSVFGFKFLGLIERVIDKSKACGLSTTKVSAEPEAENCISGSFVSFSKLFSDFCLGECGEPRMQNINNLL
ncbi:hypothetical protein EGW08_001236, partial [Elysia chlorotica]